MGPSSVAPEHVKSDSPGPVRKTFHIPEKITAGMEQIRDDLYRIEDQQMLFIDQLEVSPLSV